MYHNALPSQMQTHYILQMSQLASGKYRNAATDVSHSSVIM